MLGIQMLAAAGLKTAGRGLGKMGPWGWGAIGAGGMLGASLLANSGAVGGALVGGGIGAGIGGGLGYSRGMSFPMGRSRIIPGLLGARRGGLWGAGIGAGLGILNSGIRSNRPVNPI